MLNFVEEVNVHVQVDLKEEDDIVIFKKMSIEDSKLHLVSTYIQGTRDKTWTQVGKNDEEINGYKHKFIRRSDINYKFLIEGRQ